MPPIPVTFDTEIDSTINGIQRRAIDVNDLQLPRLHDCKGPLSLQQQYATELRETLEWLEAQTETLENISEDLRGKNERMTLKVLVEDLRASQAKMRRDMRSALLHSKKAIDLQARDKQEALFRGAVSLDEKSSGNALNEKVTDDALMKTSNDVTEALRRTIGVMQSELERSVLSHQMLERSTTTLNLTTQQHGALALITNTSKQLITALEKADWTDRMLIIAALVFFLLVVLFILKQRILDRGLRIAFWWTRFLPRMGSDVILPQEVVVHEASTGLLSSSVKGIPTRETITSISSDSAESLLSSLATTTEELLASSTPSIDLAGASAESLLSSLISDTPSETLTITTADHVIQHAEL